MRSLQLAILVAGILASGQALASAAGPFPQFGILDATCGQAHVIPAGGPLRITYQNVAQSCALQRCSVIFDEPLDASGIKVEWTGNPGKGETKPLEGRFVKTDEICGAHPVWVFEGKVPAEGAILLIAPTTSHGFIHIEKKKNDAQTPSE